MLRPSLVLALLAAPLAAEPLTRDILEAEGRIWIAEDINSNARIGNTIPLISSVRFADGRLADQFDTFGNFIFDPICETLFDCDNATHSAALFAADYEITGTGLSLGPLEESPMIFDRPDLRGAVVFDSFTRGSREIPLRLQDGALIRELPVGERRYRPGTAADLDEIYGLATFFEVSVARTGRCLINGHLDRKAGRITGPAAEALLAAAALGAEVRNIERSNDRLTRMGQIAPFDMNEFQRGIYDALLVRRIVTTFPIGYLGADIRSRRATDPDATLTMEDLENPEFVELLLGRFDGAEGVIARAQYEKIKPLVLQAFPAMMVFRDRMDAGENPERIVCDGL